MFPRIGPSQARDEPSLARAMVAQAESGKRNKRMSNQIRKRHQTYPSAQGSFDRRRSHSVPLPDLSSHRQEDPNPIGCANAYHLAIGSADRVCLRKARHSYQEGTEERRREEQESRGNRHSYHQGADHTPLRRCKSGISYGNTRAALRR